MENLHKQIEAKRNGYIESMEDDFNTAGALGYLFDLVRAINQAKDAGVSTGIVAEGQRQLQELMTVLGLRAERPAVSSQADAFISLLIDLRKELRAQKLWELSDKIRAELLELGVLLEDSQEGTDWRWK